MNGWSLCKLDLGSCHFCHEQLLVLIRAEDHTFSDEDDELVFHVAIWLTQLDYAVESNTLQ
ncbi:MAG: hypothetical protein HWQ35_00450 [Nostoc sp. NMS1]|uniref:hypothetical protein n=1 Tax=unclassified Nostoc TaxID=2593658 RepID=UPI0025DC8FFC|nr:MULTISPECIES: hypothetical protein [unclassified Nostoc]MBN3905095.1 hypothetical protein [Nostoc sp. NMS1]MBN3990281.1 hypothetical protein [Nostoc sp. NMS2]